MYNVTLRRDCATTVAVEKQKLLCILGDLGIQNAMRMRYIVIHM
jgi:hypothetical protein